MDKQQIIAFIEGQLAIGKISKDDLVNLAGGVQSSLSQSPFAPLDSMPIKEEHSRNLTHTFYGIGAIIAIVGVGILVAQNWNEIGFVGRVLVTLGISFVTYIIGLILRSPDQKMISQVMFTISAVLAPLGSYILLEEANIDFSLTSQLITATLLFVVFGMALLISKANILVLITIGFASWAYCALVMKVFMLDYYDYDNDLLKWASMLLGTSYLFLGYGYQSLWQSTDLQDEKEKKAIQNVLYGLGTFAILGAGIFVGGIFDLLLIALIFGAFYGSVYLKSRSMLTYGAVFLIAHIVNLTSKHFVDSIGWPMALMGVGFLVIGVGYVTFYLNKKFISVK